jgi:hypothetical protein
MHFSLTESWQARFPAIRFQNRFCQDFCAMCRSMIANCLWLHFGQTESWQARFHRYTVSPVILIRHTEFHMQPTSAGPGTRAHETHGMQKSAQHFLL